MAEALPDRDSELVAEPVSSAPAVAPVATPARWHSDRLFGARVEIEIEHGSAVYRLRKTSLGKLILTK